MPMQEFPSAQNPVSAEIHNELEKVYKVSEYLTFPFTLDEVANYFLPRINITGEQLRSMLSEQEFADIPFQIKDGYLLTNSAQSYESRVEREQMSAAKLDSAARFGRVLTRLVPFIRTIAVTGSVAYGSADRWDDIDLFIVTERNRLWLTALMALVFVRVSKLLGLRPHHLSPFCLSYVHDEEGFTEESQRNRSNPLFARELLKAKPIVGMDQYRKMLESNDWVANFYAAPYAAKLRALVEGNDSKRVEDQENSDRLSFLLGWGESLTFLVLSRYLRIKAYLTNLKLKSQGKALSVFEPKISAVSCIYSSNFYEWLRTLWGQ